MESIRIPDSVRCGAVFLAREMTGITVVELKSST